MGAGVSGNLVAEAMMNRPRKTIISSITTATDSISLVLSNSIYRVFIKFWFYFESFSICECKYTQFSSLGSDDPPPPPYI